MTAAPAQPQSALSRYDGNLRFAVAEGRISELSFTPPLRLFRPHPEIGEPRSIVLGNVAGGVVGGDRLAMSVDVGAGESLLATTQAAEKIYRSDGATARMAVDLAVGSAATLEYLSSGTILFDGARLMRTTCLDVAGDGKALYAEMLVFGRIARGETFVTGALRDDIRIRRDGRLLWADALGLNDGIAETLDAGAGFGGARAYATLVLAAPDAVRVRDDLRDSLHRLDGVRAGVTALDDGLVIARVLASAPDRARAALGTAWTVARSSVLDRPARLPRIWAV